LGIWQGSRVNFFSEASGIVQAQSASEEEKFAAKPTLPKTNF
jgi:hypothetical protein